MWDTTKQSWSRWKPKGSKSRKTRRKMDLLVKGRKTPRHRAKK